MWQDLRFDYDAFGRLAVKRKGGWREQRFQYDADDRLVAIHESVRGALRTVRFDYDALGRRIAKHEQAEARPAATIRFVWEGLRLAQELAEGRVRSYLYAPEGAATAAAAPYTPLARIDQRLTAEGEVLTEPPRVHYFHTDAIGTPLELTDPDGELEWIGRYDAWGKTDARHPLTNPTSAHQPLRYPGQYEDPESGLHYSTFRYYDPDTGRFITQDPIGIAGGVNLYGYARNTSGWMDPLGWCEGTAGTVAGVQKTPTGLPLPTEGQKLYRVYGGDARAGGASWSPVSPGRVRNYRDAAGLPSGGASGANNSGRFVIEGTLEDPTKVVLVRSALPLDGKKGGIPEYIIPGALENGAVKVPRVSGVNPEF